MRLYSLVSRHGRVKRGLFPWFKPPEAGAPMRYAGWRWDPGIREWVAMDVPSIQVKVKPGPYPKPTEPPRPFQTDEVEGWEWSEIYEVWEEREMPKIEKWHYPGELPWPRKPTWMPSRTLPAEVKGWKYQFEGAVWGMVPYCDIYREFRPPQPKYPPGPEGETEVIGWSWSEHYKEWLEVIYAERVIEFEPPGTLPPGLDLTLASYPGHMEMLQNHIRAWALAQGLPWGEAEGFARRAMEDFGGYGKAMTSDMYGRVWGHYAVSFWDKIGRLKFPKPPPRYGLTLEEQYAGITAWRETLNVGILVVIAAAIGATIGYILQREVFPQEGEIVHRDKRGTYLFGTDDWLYAGIRAITKKGVQYYSGCGSIGTSYIRHKRGYGAGWVDTIDFPGGFVEEGWHKGLFVKYTWSHWELEYVGFLIHTTKNLYRLQGSEDPEFLSAYSFILNDDEVCRDFTDEYL